MPLSPQQDSIYDEMEDKWSKKKAEWEKDEKVERERILLQQSEFRNLGLFDARKLALLLTSARGRGPWGHER